MSIQAKQATVYFAPTRRRTYLSKAGAINAETRAIIMERFPPERGCISCDCGDNGYHIEFDEPDRFAKMFRRLRRMVARAVR